MAEGVEIGTAYVTILPDGSKIGPEVKKSFGVVDAEAAKVGQTSGKRFGGMFSRNSSAGASQAGAQAGKKFGGLFSSTASKVIGAAGGVLAVSKLTNFLGDSLDEAREAAQVGRRTDNVIRSMGNASKISAKQIGDLSTAISNRAGVDDEAVQSGANLLLTFGKVRNEVGKGNKIFNRATGLMADMSAAMGTDMKGSAIQLGKALNDPIKGMSALARVGVSFSEAQKQTVKSLIEGGDKNAVFAMGLVKNGEEWKDALKANEGDIAATVKALTSHLSDAQKKRYDFLAEGGHQLEAQKIILGEVDKQFKGAGEAMADPAKKLQVAYGNLKEQIGTALLPTVEALEKKMTNKVIPAVSGFLDEMQTGKGKGGQAVKLFKEIRDDAEKAWRFVRKIGSAFDDLPAPVKKGLAIGGGSLFAANKIAGGLGGLRGATPATPMWVKVVGAGPGGAGVPTGAPKSRGGAASAAAAALSVEFIIENVGKELPASKMLKDSVNLLPQLEGMFGKGMDKSAQGLLSATEKFDKAMAAGVKGNGAAAFGAFQRTADRAGLSVGELGALLPETAGKINALGGRANYAKGQTENWRNTIVGTNKQLDKLDAKRPSVKIHSNALDVLEALRNVGRQMDTLTEKKARVRLAISSGGTGFGFQRASGGPAYMGQQYTVNEHLSGLREQFVPEVNGRILSRRDAMAALAGRGGPGVQINVDKLMPHDYNDFTRQMQSRAARAQMGGF